MKKRSPFFSKNWLRTFLFTAFTASFSLNLKAQTAPAKLWDKTFGGSGTEYLFSLQQTSDGGYILGGYSDSGISGDKNQASMGGNDYWVVKLNANGNKTWDKTFGGSGHDYLLSLQQTSDGGYILGGYSQSGNSGDKSQASKGADDYWIVKLDANGNKVWDKSFGGNGDDHFYTLQQTSDGGYILGGSSYSDITGDKSQVCEGKYDYWIVKLDTNGNKIWDKTIGGSDDDVLASIHQTSDGGYILGGFSDSGISGDKSQPNQGPHFTEDYWVVKLDANGKKTWDKTFGGGSEDYLYSLQQTSDGGYILGGFSDSGISSDKSQASKGSADYWVIKMDSTGNKTWDKSFGGSSYDEITFLQQTSDGGYILGGNSFSGLGGDKTQASQGGSDYWVVRIDAMGNKLWDKTLGGSDDDGLYDLQLTSDGGYILGGYSLSGLNGDKSQASQGGRDYWIVKLDASVTGIKQETNFSLSISPNPSQGKFNLKLNGLTSQAVGVTVSDLLGRVVLQENFQTTDQQISSELTLPNAKGIYLLQLKTGEQTITRKIVVE